MPKQNRFFSALLLSVILLLTGCQAPHLNIQTQYISREDLASSYTDTPDAEWHSPTIGQRLLIEWALPDDYSAYENLTLLLKVRFKNRQEEESRFTINNQRGTYLYYVVNEKFCQTGGIITYKAEISNGECVLDSWVHPLWMNLITFQIPD